MEISAARRSLPAAMVAGLVALVAVPVASAAQAGSAARAGERRAAPPVIVPRASSRSIVFGGLSAQNWPVVLAISPNSRRLRLAVIGVRMGCSSGGSFAVEDAFGGLAIGATGKVHAAGRIRPVPLPNVSLIGGSHSMTGVLHRRSSTFTGFWHLHLDYRLSDGTTDHCDSGVVAFVAQL
jgi:hypothetical protein